MEDIIDEDAEAVGYKKYGRLQTSMAQYNLGKRINRNLTKTQAQRAKENLTTIYNDLFKDEPLEQQSSLDADNTIDIGDDDPPRQFIYQFNDLQMAWLAAQQFQRVSFETHRVNIPKEEHATSSKIKTIEQLESNSRALEELFYKTQLFYEGSQYLDQIGAGINPLIYKKLQAHSYSRFYDHLSQLSNFNARAIRFVEKAVEQNKPVPDEQLEYYKTYKYMKDSVDQFKINVDSLDDIAGSIIDYGADDIQEAYDRMYDVLQNENIIVPYTGTETDYDDIDLTGAEEGDDGNDEYNPDVILDQQVLVNAIDNMQQLGAHAQFGQSDQVQQELFMRGESDLLSSDAVYRMQRAFGFQPSNDGELNQSFNEVARAVPEFDTLINEYLSKTSNNADLADFDGRLPGVLFMGGLANIMLSRQPELNAKTEQEKSNIIRAQKQISRTMLQDIILNDSQFDAASTTSADQRIIDRYQMITQEGGIQELMKLKDARKVQLASKLNYAASIAKVADYYNKYADNHNDRIYQGATEYIRQFNQIAKNAPPQIVYQPTQYVSLSTRYQQQQQQQELQIPQIGTIQTIKEPFYMPPALLEIFKKIGIATQDSEINNITMYKTSDKMIGQKKLLQFNGQNVHDNKVFKWIKRGLEILDSQKILPQVRNYARWGLRQLNIEEPIYDPSNTLYQAIEDVADQPYVDIKDPSNFMVKGLFDTSKKSVRGRQLPPAVRKEFILSEVDDYEFQKAYRRAKEREKKYSRRIKFETLSRPDPPTNPALVSAGPLQTYTLAPVNTLVTSAQQQQPPPATNPPTLEELIMSVAEQSSRIIDLTQESMQQQMVDTTVAQDEEIKKEEDSMTIDTEVINPPAPTLSQPSRFTKLKNRILDAVNGISQESEDVRELMQKRQKVAEQEQRIIQLEQQKTTMQATIEEMQKEFKKRESIPSESTLRISQQLQQQVVQQELQKSKDQITRMENEARQLRDQLAIDNNMISQLQQKIVVKPQTIDQESQAQIEQKIKDRSQLSAFLTFQDSIIKQIDVINQSSRQLKQRGVQTVDQEEEKMVIDTSSQQQQRAPLSSQLTQQESIVNERRRQQLAEADQRARAKIREEYKKLIDIVQSGSFGQLIQYGRGVSDSKLKQGYMLLDEIGKDIVQKYQQRMGDVSMVDVSDNQQQMLGDDNVGEIINNVKLRELLDINSQIRADNTAFEAKQKQLKEQIQAEKNKLDTLVAQQTELQKKVAKQQDVFDKTLASTLAAKSNELQKIQKELVSNKDRGDKLAELQVLENQLKAELANSMPLNQVIQKIIAQKQKIKDLKDQTAQLKEQNKKDLEVMSELDAASAKHMAQYSINTKLAQMRANAQQRFQDVTLAQNSGQMMQQLIQANQQTDPIDSYEDNIKQIEKYGKMLGANVEFLAAEKKTFDARNFEKFVYNLEYLRNFDFPVPAMREFFQSQQFKDFNDNIVTDYINNVSKVQSYSVMLSAFANSPILTPQELDHLKKKLESDETGTKIKQSTQRIKAIEEVAFAIDDKIIKGVYGASLKYAKLKGLFGSDDKFVEEYNEAAKQFTGALNNLMVASTESKSSSGNVSGISNAVTAVQKQFRVMKDHWNNFTADKHSKVLAPILNTINRKAIADFQAVVTAVNQRLQSGPQQVEQMTLSFAEKVAQAQTKIALESGKRFMSIHRKNPDFSAINHALNADNFIEAFNLVNNLTQNQLSVGVKAQIKEIFRTQNNVLHDELVSYMAHHATGQLQTIMDGLPTAAIKAAFTDPEHFGRELLVSVVGNNQIQQIKKPTFSNFLGREMQVLDKYAVDSYQKLQGIAQDAANNNSTIILQNARDTNQQRVNEVAQQIAADPFSVQNAMSKSRFLDKAASSANATKSLYQFYGATPQLFQKKVASLDSTSIRTVQRDIQQQQSDNQVIQQRGGSMLANPANPTSQKIKNISQVVFGEAIRVLEENNQLTAQQRNSALGLLSQNDFQLHRTMMQLNNSFADGQGQKIGEFMKHIFSHGIPLLISQVEAVYQNSVDNQVFVPSSVEENITAVQQFLTELDSNVLQANAGNNQYMRPAQVTTMRNQLQQFQQYSEELKQSSLGFNKHIASYNLQQLDQAYDLIRQRDKFASQENKINEFAQSKTDSVMSSIDKMLYKLALDRSDLSDRRDPNEGRQIARAAVNQMVPRAYTQLPGFGRLDQRPQTRFAVQGSDFDRNLNDFNKKQVRGSSAATVAGGGATDESQLLKSSRFTQAYKLADFNGDSIAFLRSIQLVDGVPTINGQPLSQEQRTKLARLIVALVIAVFAINYQNQAQVKELVDNKQELMQDAQDEERLPRMLTLVDNMMKTIIKKRRV